MVLLQIPGHSQKDVLKKLDFKDFVKLKKCSKEAVEMTKNFRHPLHIAVEIISFESNSFIFHVGRKRKGRGLELLSEEPVRLEVKTFLFYETMSSEQFHYMREFCQKTKLVAKSLQLGSANTFVNNEPSFVDNVISLLKAEELDSAGFQPASSLLNLRELSRVKRVCVYSDMADSDILRLKHPGLVVIGKRVNPLTVSGLLKQWVKGNREIEHLRLRIPNGSSALFQDLEVDVLWPPGIQKSSSLAHLEENIVGQSGEIKKIYSLKRNDGKKIFIETSKWFGGQVENVVAKEYEDPAEIEKWIREDEH